MINSHEGLHKAIKRQLDGYLNRESYELTKRKWYKYICKHGLYEKSVRITGIVTANQFHTELVLRTVTEKFFRVVKQDHIKNGPLAGIQIARLYEVDGYYRIRTENSYYPICGKEGIPHRNLSRAAKDFSKYDGECYDRAAAIIRRKAAEKYWAELEKAKKEIPKTQIQILLFNRKQERAIKSELARKKKQLLKASRKIQVAKNKAERDAARELKNNQYKPNAAADKLARSYMTALIAAQEFVSVMTKEKKTKPQKKLKP